MPRYLEPRADNQARLRPWPEELTVENVAAWIMANAVNPIDAHPILHAHLQDAVKGAAVVTACAGQRVQALTDMVEKFCAYLWDDETPLVQQAYKLLGRKVDVIA